MALGEHCSSSCVAKDHSTFGECMRSKNLRIAYCNSAAGRDYTDQKRADKELATFRQAVADGHQPESTRTLDSLSAMEFGERTGQAYAPEPEPQFVSGPAAREGVFG